MIIFLVSHCAKLDELNGGSRDSGMGSRFDLVISQCLVCTWYGHWLVPKLVTAVSTVNRRSTFDKQKNLSIRNAECGMRWHWNNFSQVQENQQYNIIYCFWPVLLVIGNAWLATLPWCESVTAPLVFWPNWERAEGSVRNGSVKIISYRIGCWLTLGTDLWRHLSAINLSLADKVNVFWHCLPYCHIYLRYNWKRSSGADTLPEKRVGMGLFESGFRVWRGLELFARFIQESGDRWQWTCSGDINALT